MKKITLFILMTISCISMHAQIANTTGLSGDDLIFYEDCRYFTEFGEATPPNNSDFTLKRVVAGSTTPVIVADFPADGTGGNKDNFAIPANTYPNSQTTDNKGLKIVPHNGTENHTTDSWIIVNSVDLSGYDGGSKYFTFHTKISFYENGADKIDESSIKLAYATNFNTGDDPQGGGVTWVDLTGSITTIGGSGVLGRDGKWTTNQIDLSAITGGSKFAIRIRRQTSNLGPDGTGVFSKTTNRNGAFFFSNPTFTGTRVTNTWQGGTNEWNTGTNWSTGAKPTATENVVIPDLANDPIINATTGAVAHDITTNNVLTINSGGSLIPLGTSTGNVTYQVTSNDTNWHLLSSPLVGATYNGTWITDNDIDDVGTGTNVAISTYTNTVDADGDWNYVTDATNSGTFATAQGYSLKKDATTNDYISFTGTLKTNNLTSSIDQNTNNWNLKGNPYSSYILVSDIITDNAANLTDTHEMVYVFDNNKAGGAGYKALTGTDYIHPGQGFFVNASNSTADNFTIDASKLSHQTGKTLYKTAGSHSVNLLITSEVTTKFTEINYVANKTAGLDPSFDVGVFTGEASSFNVYTQLVADNEGVDFMRQVLPNSDYENMIIPVGVKSEAGKEITFSAEALNLPSGIKVFLEDRLTNTFTRLDEANSEYKVTFTETVNGIGRFYLYTTQSVLNIDTNATFENINVFKADNSTLRIVGLQQGKTIVKLFNVLGKQVLNSSFNSNGVKNISLPKLATGVYIVQLSSEAGKLNKKIILE